MILCRQCETVRYCLSSNTCIPLVQDDVGDEVETYGQVNGVLKYFFIALSLLAFVCVLAIPFIFSK